ncbi:Phosphatidylglycerol phospholipase C [Hyphodiscus hymeniophilus]|uniref:Phosphatidylglycerol phospholipase C n=1 Tax=Hyphodiscus hymeniophilus TaxID=353542 RepID=A0A9P7B167_9HELO|nr:Phosphatidylglycerol phospholipase C [Hyphodiscus hymeniophilus]
MAETQALLPEKKGASQFAMFTSANSSASGRKLPQAIAHRGYKAAFPENTMGAFKGAVTLGAHIETDVHLSKDGVVVLSHDVNLKRCFGENTKIADCDWSYLKTLKTLKAPHESMPRLKDLLDFLTTPGLEDIWVLLDIKLDDDSDDMMRLIAETLRDVKPTKPWKQRIALGCWTTSYLPLCAKYLPQYPIVHIGFSMAYAREFLKVPNVAFNIQYMIMAGPGGNGLLRDAQAAKRDVLLWTINDANWMKWAIEKGVDGVITDDPKKYLEVCKNYTGEKIRLGWKAWGTVLVMNAFARIFIFLFRRAKFRGQSVDMIKLKAIMEENAAEEI